MLKPSIFRRLWYALRLALSNNEGLAFMLVESEEGVKLDVYSNIREEDTLLLLTPYMQALIDSALGEESQEAN